MGRITGFLTPSRERSSRPDATTALLTALPAATGWVGAGSVDFLLTLPVVSP